MSDVSRAKSKYLLNPSVYDKLKFSPNMNIVLILSALSNLMIPGVTPRSVALSGNANVAEMEILCFDNVNCLIQQFS